MAEYEYIGDGCVRVHWRWLSTSTLAMAEYEYIGDG